jgi:hypothetical protein
MAWPDRESTKHVAIYRNATGALMGCPAALKI